MQMPMQAVTISNFHQDHAAEIIHPFSQSNFKVVKEFIPIAETGRIQQGLHIRKAALAVPAGP